MKKQIKVAYFSSDTPKNKVLGSNGKSLDRYCIKCEAEDDFSTGNYICDLTFLIDDNIQDLLQEEAILKILMDYGNEIFRISKVTVGTRYIYIVARQITIADSLTLWLEDVRPTNLNGQGAVSWLLDNAQGKKEIQIISDIDTVATAYYQRMSLYKALHDNDNSFLNRWGGEIQRRGYTIYINKRIGIDRGFTIREGKNLTGFESASNIDNLVTRAIGQGYNGILGNYIDSPLIGSYNRIYTSVIKYDDIKVKDEYSEEGYDTLEQAQAELDRRIGEEFSKNDIDKIKASYIINFVQLEKTEEYKKYIVAEKLFIGDDCRVYIPKLNVDIKVRAMTKKYDVLAQQTKEIKLSNYIEVKPLSIKQVIEKLESIDSTETILQLAKDNATSLIKGGLKNSYVIVRENEIIIGDTKDINTMTKVWRWNNGGLGFSNAGYYGEFGTAITQDGAIVADFITTGILTANLIKAGVLKSFNGKTWINMDDGTFNFADKIKFDGSNFEIDLSGEDLATGTDVEEIKSEIKAAKEEINLKVGKGEIISAINLTPETIKISANKINLQGYVTISDLKDGETIISGDNIQTGTISAININTCTFRGKNMIYIENDGILSCDGIAYIKDLRILETNSGWSGTGAFWCGPTANFEKEVRTAGEFWSAANTSTYLGVIRRSAGGTGKIQIDRMRIVNSSSKNYIEIACYNNNSVFGVDVWASDERLKENIKKIDCNNYIRTLNDDKKIGLDLINNLNHYTFDFKESFGGGHVACGYLSQELQELNDNLVVEIEQQDGTTLLQPSASNIIPNITLALKQQQEIIENQQNKIKTLEEKLANLEKLVEEVLNK